MSRQASPDFYPVLRPLLFRLDPEAAHRRTLDLLRLLGGSGVGRSMLRNLAGPPAEGEGIDCLGLRFPNRLGLAAGYDKDGVALRGLACLGFGHLEIGTVTPQPQPGNAPPRLFRLEQDLALINRLGFPSRGAVAVEKALHADRPKSVVIGVNLGKGAGTPLEEAAEDYLSLVETFRPLADYLTVNVSSPNTLGLRRLQGREHLERLLGQVWRRLEQGPGRRPPLLVKLAPDLAPQELEDALGACLGRADGVIATNTTTSRPRIKGRHALETGGLSGRPLFALALEQVKRIVRWSEGRLVVVGCGGISSPDNLRAMLDAGASLVQIYSAVVYQGPRVVGRLLRSG
jgi:dihydroorotate dehydrogenase